jgi:hypothetical protein
MAIAIDASGEKPDRLEVRNVSDINVGRDAIAASRLILYCLQLPSGGNQFAR